ncbi:hypothetical protein JTB14_028013 [Gonioctena quinquepunctata]|nr:hypothetical protein JTB14_028013 [Gonioctena quinquepunctata]
MQELILNSCQYPSRASMDLIAPLQVDSKMQNVLFEESQISCYIIIIDLEARNVPCVVEKNKLQEKCSTREKYMGKTFHSAKDRTNEKGFLASRTNVVETLLQYFFDLAVVNSWMKVNIAERSCPKIKN